MTVKRRNWRCTRVTPIEHHGERGGGGRHSVLRGRLRHTNCHPSSSSCSCFISRSGRRLPNNEKSTRRWRTTRATRGLRAWCRIDSSRRLHVARVKRVGRKRKSLPGSSSNYCLRAFSVLIYTRVYDKHLQTTVEPIDATRRLTSCRAGEISRIVGALPQS